MDVFSKIGVSMRRGIALLGVSAASSCRKMKLRVHIDTLKAEAEKLKAGVADEAYAIWKNGGDLQQLSARFESMDAVMEKIKDLEAEIKAADYESNEIFGWEKSGSVKQAGFSRTPEEPAVNTEPEPENAETEETAEAEADDFAPEAEGAAEPAFAGEEGGEDGIDPEALQEAYEASELEAETAE
ncbi:MAG: hypothetical protein IJ061_05730 [Lachnospiraceae bacterium]|nr:hypothetical protein [Lachnospiraceae bacterium]